LLGRGLNSIGEYNYTRQPFAAWFTIILAWTCGIGRRSSCCSPTPAWFRFPRPLPGREDRRRAAWAVFRYIQLPKLKYVLTIAILLRFMDSFMVYTEVVVLTGGGPGNATTFLSIDLVKTALGQFDLGPAAAMSLIYFLIVLLFSWLFYTLMMRNESR
jgi:glycerol transport system permease protein